MFKFKLCRNQENEITHVETSLTGRDLLSSPKLNKGCAFTNEEREQFGIIGLLPYQVETLEQQAARMYVQFSEHHTNLGKNIYLNVLHDYNETLFYKLVSEHLEEILPIIYTPTVGEAVQRFSLEHRKTRGLYINYPDRHHMDEIINRRRPDDVNLTVVTDGQAVLGIGDQGIGGINISIGKLMVYSVCAGVNPHEVLPIQLDVGTNNPHLLNDPMYLGWRHERITSQEYDDFIDLFVNAITKKFPHVVIHWEDFGRDNARRILDRYRNQICTFNGDIQSTAVVALASVLAGVLASGIPLSEHQVVIMGAGTAGVGIADHIHEAFLREGLSETEARDRIWLVDKSGLLCADSELLIFQKHHAKPLEIVKGWSLENPNHIGLYDVIKNVKPSILIGCSTATGIFDERIVRLMAHETPRPIIMPLSNPNSLSEAKPEDLLKWTNGKVLMATGSPFPKVHFEDKWFRVAQSNNALAFPGIGLGAIASKASHITDDMLWAATLALRDCSPVNQDKLAPLLPKLSESNMVSYHVALAVAEQARKDKVAQVHDQINFKEAIKKIIWRPRYYPYKKPV